MTDNTKLNPSSSRLSVTVISPHHDDAAFSAGALLKLLADADFAITIVNCFTRSRFLPFYRSPEADPRSIRQTEDASFVAFLGTACRSQDLGLSDVQLRTGQGVRSMMQSGRLPPNERTTLCHLARRLEGSRIDGAVFVPLAAGSHTDHRIACEAAIRAYREGPVAFYEDLPYSARRPGQVHVALAAVQSMLETTLSPLTVNSEHGPLWKRAACACYPSQLSPEGVEKIVDYLQSVNGERIWVTPRFAQAAAGRYLEATAALVCELAPQRTLP
jgi:LmbE family N-acetylglucosaminyl deacetylase